MRNSGRRDGDDARPDSTDPSTPQAGSAGDPADDDIAGVPASPDPADAVDSTGGDLDAASEFADLSDDSPDFDDDLLFDPLLSDEPIDLAAVRADDALIDALGGGDPAGADDLVDPDDPLIAMLAAWAASARPDAEPASRLTDEPAPAGKESIEPGDTDAGDTDSHGTPDSPDLDLPTIRLLAPGLRPSAGPRPHAGSGDPAVPVQPVAGIAPAAPAAVVALTAAPVAGLLSRVRTLRRRPRPAGQALPPGHPLRRAAVAVVIVALGLSGAAASGGTAQPGDPAWAISEVFFAKRARSIKAAQVVSAGLERAELALRRGQHDVAVRELDAVSASLQSVGEAEGHKQLVYQQRMLQAVLALTPPLPNDPNLTTTTTPIGPSDPDTSVLAQGAPPAADTEKADTDKAVPPVLTEPADPAGPAAAASTTTDGAAADPATGETGATGTETGTTDTGTTGTDTTGTETDTETGTTETGTDATGTTDTTGTETGDTTDTTGTETGTGTTGTGTGTGTTGTTPDTGETDTTPGEAGAPAGDTGPAVPDPGPVLAATPDTARSADTPGAVATGATATESTVPSTAPSTAPDTEPPPPPADDPARVLGAPADAAAPVETEIDGASPNPAGDEPDAARVVAEGTAPAVAASATAEATGGGAVSPVQPLRTVETGVVPEPVNIKPDPDADVAAPDDTEPGGPGRAARNEPADEPLDSDTTNNGTTNNGTDAAAARGAAPDDAEAAEPVRVSADDPEPVRVSTDDGDGDESTGDSRSGSGDGSETGDDDSGPGSGDDSDDDHSGPGGDDDHDDDHDGGVAGARVSAAVSIG